MKGFATRMFGVEEDRNSVLPCGLALGVRVSFRFWVGCGVAVGLLGLDAGSGTAAAQRVADPTAQRRLDLSAFGMVSGVYTGLGSSPLLNDGIHEGPEGRNASFSAGADLGFYTLFGLRLGGEVRGEIPLKSGQVDGQKSILGGIRLTHEPSGYGVFGRVRPYVDVLAGRGSITYQGGGYPLPGVLYLSNNSAVYGAGGGFEIDVTRAFSVKADAQIQRWNTPVTASGVIYSKQGGLGVVYRYGTGRGPR